MYHRAFTIQAGALCFGCLLSPSCAENELPSAAVALTRQPVRGSADGAAVVSTADTVVNRYAVLGQDARRGDRSLILSAAAGRGVAALLPLNPGDMLLIAQAQGADITLDRDVIGFGAVTDYGDAGRFELVTVKSVDDTAGRIEIYGNCGGLRNNYSVAGHVQVIRVPQFETLTVQAGASVGAPPWDGATGGVVAILVRGSAQVDGAIDTSGRGFRGGQRTPITTVRQPGVGAFYASLSQLDGGAKGEGVAGSASEYAQLGTYGRGAAANGGGGGNRLVAGGGGGGNGGASAAWNGQGIMPQGVLGGAQAWPLDPSYDVTRTSFAGGGRGGYTASGALLDPTTTAPGNVLWLQDYRRERGGLGGRPVPNDPRSRLFLGGGGGAGDDFQSKSGRGGQGGGLVFFAAEQISGSGRILANGEDGAAAESTTSGGGGGGAGGTLVLSASSLTGVGLEARGGRGGSQSNTGSQAAGPGGGGGGGFVAVPAGAQATLSIDGGVGGTTASSDLVKFPRNGATDGAPGQADGVTQGEFGTSQFCASADVSVQIVPTPAQAQALDPVTLQLDVRNNGPSPAADVQIRLRVPAGSSLQQMQPGGWSCTISGEELTCKLSQLAAGESSPIVVSLTPPLSARELPLRAEITADSPDLDSSNNTAELLLTNAGPISEKLAGGGLSCALSQGRAAPAAGAHGTLALLLSALLAAVARRRTQSRNS